MTADELLQPFGRFGVRLGLERSQQLLAVLGQPQQRVPIIHVAGTNGKGSVCAYLSAVLTAAGYRVGRYTSPHLVDWTERICLNEQPIARPVLLDLLRAVRDAIAPQPDPPTQFEIFTAAAWLYFARQAVDLAVVEVGLGGRLDATNVVDQPLVTVITSIGFDHTQVLGNTLAAIAREKAGILKPGRPAVIGPLPPEAQAAVAAQQQAVGGPVIWVEPAVPVSASRIRFQPPDQSDLPLTALDYSLPLAGAVQLTNSAIAIAALQALRVQGWAVSDTTIQTGLANARWPGRLQQLRWQQREILIDGAHNPPAAIALRQYVDAWQEPVVWVLGILSSKDDRGVLAALLRPGDRFHAVAVPDHATIAPSELIVLAKELCPELADSREYASVEAALLDSGRSDRLVLCGSLYLIGAFLHQIQNEAEA
ncbi:MAG: bifunctional folylpolyglutamate synthase/dihydrofolate synthase [Spirulinaceae cyanobacterium SM2_1_0]|nr:bifunctional folylpolyglutamate synthase/dihydrofolate synthase [Spirulinaceae cyanobacterium SM2_1_0]